MSANITQISPVLPVACVKSAIDWYEQMLGFESIFINRDEDDTTGETWAYALLDGDGVSIHLCRIVLDDATLNSPANIYAMVNNLRDLHARLKAADADVTELQKMPWESLECWLHDPDGNRLVLSESS